MIRDQLFLFPELDFFKTKIKDIDYVDLSTLKRSHETRKNPYSLLPKDTYFIFKTGGYNKYMPELGAVFPYIQNIKNKKILQARLKTTYVKASLTVHVGKKQVGFEVRLHRAAAEAFIINDDPVNKQIADHINRNRLDYRVENIRWITYSENNKVARPQGINYEEKIYFPDSKNKI